MIENQEQYETEKSRYETLIKLTQEYKEKARKNKGDLEIKIQYDIFKGQLSEVEREIKAYEKILSKNANK